MSAGSGPIVLVHGLYGNFFGPLATVFRKRQRNVYCPTLSRCDGHGATVEARIDDLVDYVKGLNLKDTLLIGHSFGGVYISQAAERLRPHVGAIGYLVAAVFDEGDDSLLSHCPDDIQASKRLQAECNDGFVHAEGRMWTKLFEAAPDLEAFVQKEPMDLLTYKAWRLPPALKTGRIPAFAIFFSDDEIPGGHFAIVQQPEEVAAAVDACMKRISSTCI